MGKFGSTFDPRVHHQLKISLMISSPNMVGSLHDICHTHHFPTVLSTQSIDGCVGVGVSKSLVVFDRFSGGIDWQVARWSDLVMVSFSRCVHWAFGEVDVPCAKFTAPKPPILPRCPEMSRNWQHQSSVAKKASCNRITVPQKPSSPPVPFASLCNWILSLCFSLRLTSKTSTTTRSRLSLKTSKWDLSSSFL